MGPDNTKFKPGVYAKFELADAVKLRQIDCPTIEMPSKAFARLLDENRKLEIELAAAKARDFPQIDCRPGCRRCGDTAEKISVL